MTKPLGEQFDEAFRDQDEQRVLGIANQYVQRFGKQHYGKYPDYLDIVQDITLQFCQNYRRFCERAERFHRPYVGLIYMTAFRFRKFYSIYESKRIESREVADGDLAFADSALHLPKSWNTLERACCADSSRKYLEVLVKSADQFRFPRYRQQYLGLVERWIWHHDEEMPSVSLAIRQSALYWLRSRISILDTVEAMSR